MGGGRDREGEKVRERGGEYGKRGGGEGGEEEGWKRRGGRWDANANIKDCGYVIYR